MLRALARIHAEELARHYEQAAKKSGEGGKLHAGAVTLVQRFGSSLNLHVHLHTCALDGVYVEAEVLAQVATQRGTLENVQDDTGESEGPAEPAAPLQDEAVTRHGFNMHASLTITADDDLGRVPRAVEKEMAHSSA